MYDKNMKLAQSYVPIQKFEKIYSAIDSLKEGTAFEGLAKAAKENYTPSSVMGVKIPDRASTIDPELKALCEYGFKALDLQLFIDVNPDCVEAIEKYNETVELYKKAKEVYERKAGALRSFVCGSSDNNFDYIKSPWPWD